VIPGQFIPGVEKGVREAMQEGILAGYPVVDVKAAVFYGQYHPVDSSELSFKIAARECFKLAAQQAEPTLLEPIMHLAVTTPEAFTGDIISDLNSRRGRILGMESQGGKTVIRAEVPLAEVMSYALDLKSLTQGRATFQMEFVRYDYVPAQLQEKVVAQAKAGKDES
jgi:elongation factor G